MDACLEGHFVINCDIPWNKAKLLFELSYNLKIRSAVEGVPSSMQQFQQMISHMSPSQFQSLEASGDDISVKDGNAVSNTITTIEKHGSHHTLSKEGHESLHAILYFIDLELLEE